LGAALPASAKKEFDAPRGRATMGRTVKGTAMRRVSYHQSVFDLIDVQPPLSAEARKAVEAAEVGCGHRLPASVRDWYLHENTVPLIQRDRHRRGAPNSLWYDYSNQDSPEPLAEVLDHFAQAAGQPRTRRRVPRLRLAVENQGVCSWHVRLTGSDDPPVVSEWPYRSPDGLRRVRWQKAAPTFSEFLFDWFGDFYFQDWTPLSERSDTRRDRDKEPREKPYLNGLWLYAPAALPLYPPHLDFLLEHFDELSRREISPGVTQHQFRNPHGRLRVTTDAAREEDGVSAWWLHADTEDDLFHLARRVWDCGTLKRHLKPCSPPRQPDLPESGRRIMDRLRGDNPPPPSDPPKKRKPK
jgi:hypothetical protein